MLSALNIKHFVARFSECVCDYCAHSLCEIRLVVFFYVRHTLSTVWLQSMLLSLLNVTRVSSGRCSFVSGSM